MTIITKGTKSYTFHLDTTTTYYPLHVAALDTHRPLSHRYSVFEQLRYCEAMDEMTIENEITRREAHTTGSRLIGSIT